MPRCEHLRLYGFCGLCYSGRRGRQSYRGHTAYRARHPFLKGAGVVALTKPSDRPKEEGRPPEDEGGPGVLVGPTLRSYLFDTAWADGSRRQPATLLLFVEGGFWKCCISDRATDRNAFLSARTLGGLFQALEEGLASDRVEWRYKGPGGPRRGR